MADVGQLITGEAQRDAIHVAIMPAVASQELHPGMRVGLLHKNWARFCSGRGAVGIVDPFLTKPVQPTEQFWLFLFPGTITSLRHDWSHKMVDDAARANPQHPSAVWMRDYADGLDLTYEELLDGARAWIRSGQYLLGGSNLEGERVPPEFWDHYEAVTGTEVPERSRESFFTCSC